jgi:MFS family permease
MRRRIFGIGLGIAGLAVLLAFVPHLRSLVWPGIAWGLLVVSAIVVLGVAVSILVSVVSMYTGYSSASDEFRGTGNALSDVQDAVAPFSNESTQHRIAS